MSSNIEDHLDPSSFKLPPLDAPPPPQYNERTSPPLSKADLKANDDASYTHAPWLLKKTSVHVESTPANVLDDNLSDHISISTTTSDEKHATRNLLSRFNRQPFNQQQHDDHISVADSHETSIFGTTVSIEAAKPRKVITRQREIKGLEQAASVKRWVGNGKPAEPWGKLIKDPELWDSNGDTLVYFGYQRPHASFRVRSSMLEATKSDVLIGKLQDGFKRASAAQSTYSSPPNIQDLRINRKGHQATPSIAGSARSENEGPIRYEIHFPPPDEGTKTTVLRHHITTRNFFALLLKKPLVGLTLYQALVDLHQRLQLYLPRETNCTRLLITYISEPGLHLHNVSNDPAAAAGLLAWSEETDVSWRDGWREGFVHCCGMYIHLKDLPEYWDISHVSRTLLERSHLELEVRIQEAEARLSCFSFDDIWAGSEVQLHPSRTVFDNFRRFLQQYYTKAHKQWPPTNGEANASWVTSDIVFQLQRDFAALYEYHVDRDTVWNKNREPGASHRAMMRKGDRQPVQEAETGPCLAKLLYRFDEKHKYPHIPYPYPLLPDLSLIANETRQTKTHLFSSKTKALEKRITLAFSDASNATLLGPEFAANGLAEAFLRFEKSDNLGDADPQSARKARWILLYGILQILATLSVDTPGLFFAEGVGYFLNPRLRGTPPWKNDGGDVFEEASARLSYCWVAPELSWGKSIPHS